MTSCLLSYTEEILIYIQKQRGSIGREEGIRKLDERGDASWMVRYESDAYA